MYFFYLSLSIRFFFLKPNMAYLRLSYSSSIYRCIFQYNSFMTIYKITLSSSLKFSFFHSSIRINFIFPFTNDSTCFVEIYIVTSICCCRINQLKNGIRYSIRHEFEYHKCFFVRTFTNRINYYSCFVL